MNPVTLDWMKIIVYEKGDEEKGRKKGFKKKQGDE